MLIFGCLFFVFFASFFFLSSCCVSWRVLWLFCEFLQSAKWLFLELHFKWSVYLRFGFIHADNLYLLIVLLFVYFEVGSRRVFELVTAKEEDNKKVLNVCAKQNNKINSSITPSANIYISIITPPPTAKLEVISHPLLTVSSLPRPLLKLNRSLLPAQLWHSII